MSQETEKKNGKKPAKGSPVPVRFDGDEEKFVDDMVTQTGLAKQEIIRRACRYAVPKFLSGEVNILEVVPEVKIPA